MRETLLLFLAVTCCGTLCAIKLPHMHPLPSSRAFKSADVLGTHYQEVSKKTRNQFLIISYTTRCTDGDHGDTFINMEVVHSNG